MVFKFLISLILEIPPAIIRGILHILETLVINSISGPSSVPSLSTDVSKIYPTPFFVNSSIHFITFTLVLSLPFSTYAYQVLSIFFA